MNPFDLKQLGLDVEYPYRQQYDNYIGGKWVPPVKGEYFENVSPINGKPFCRVPRSSADDIEVALDAAHAARRKWGKTSVAERANLLLAAADRMEKNLKLLAVAETIDNGKPLRETMAADLPLAIDHFRYFAGCIRAQEGGISEIDDNTVAYHFHEPLGVVGQIIPWNFPLSMLAWKVAPALAAGCTIVLKPAEQTPLGALFFGKLVQDAGFPEGVVNILTGFGETVGAAMAAHPDIDKVAFTGSTEVGRLIARAATGNLKKVSLELGGKAPTIVLGDADIDMAVAGASSAAFFNAGQSCGAGTRFFVHKKIYDKVMSGIAARAEKLKLGAGLDPSTELGPVVSQQQMERITRLISEGRSDGAEIVTGGTRAGDTGYFVKPTVISRTRPDMSVIREEIFGPVACAMPFDDEDLDQLARDANDTEYGLAASIWTNNLGTAHRLAAKIKSGTVWVNCHNFNDVTMPFGGFKQSGWGRELGEQALQLYTETKTVAIRLP